MGVLLLVVSLLNRSPATKTAAGRCGAWESAIRVPGEPGRLIPTRCAWTNVSAATRMDSRQRVNCDAATSTGQTASGPRCPRLPDPSWDSVTALVACAVLTAHRPVSAQIEPAPSTMTTGMSPQPPESPEYQRLQQRLAANGTPGTCTA